MQDAQAFYLREVQLIERQFPIPVADASAGAIFGQTMLPIESQLKQYYASKGASAERKGYKAYKAYKAMKKSKKEKY